MRKAKAEAIRPPARRIASRRYLSRRDQRFRLTRPFFRARPAVVMGDPDEADELSTGLLLNAARRAHCTIPDTDARGHF
jgi:hypothetical protein